jgi:hypothetical protein
MQNSTAPTSLSEIKPQEDGRSQLPDEPGLWYKRYCLYRDLGHKRSLRAAVAKERESLRIVKEPVTATKSPQKKKASPTASPKDVKPVQTVQVPGSWKNAYKAYRWKERVQGFDTWLINKSVDLTEAHLGGTYANAYKRVMLLETLIKSAYDQWAAAVKAGTTHENYLLYIKRIQSLLDQMHAEMRGLDDATMRAGIEAWHLTFLDDIEKAYHSGSTKMEIKL